MFDIPHPISRHPVCPVLYPQGEGVFLGFVFNEDMKGLKTLKDIPEFNGKLEIDASPEGGRIIGEFPLDELTLVITPDQIPAETSDVIKEIVLKAIEQFKAA